MELPLSFVRRMENLLGSDESARMLDALRGDSPVSIRLNRMKLTWGGEASSVAFREPSERVPWCADGYYLPSRPAFTFDPLLHAGCYYVQEASSMFVEQALKQHLPADRPVAMLDLCAAPGGKSTHVRSLLPEGSLLVANEVMRNRAQVLAENLAKWGHPDVVVTNNDPADFAPLAGCFDVLLTDVPCSGEGMFRKDPASVEEWSEENVEVCWQRQRRILSDIWPCLKPGGLLVYSTCTYNEKEDEENVRWISDELGAEVLPLETAPEWGVTGNLVPGETFPVYRFLPHRTLGEGFFLAVLRKSGGEDGTMQDDQYACPAASGRMRKKDSRSAGTKRAGKGGKADVSAFSKEQLAMIRGWLQDADGYALQTEGATVSAFPERWLPLLPALRASLRVLLAGVCVAEVKGRDLMPCHHLALSSLLCREAFPTEEVDYDRAIAYLRKEAVVLSDAVPRGYVLLTFAGFPLGFVKNVGNRANNLYPQEWRIRSGYVPQAGYFFWNTRR